MRKRLGNSGGVSRRGMIKLVGGVTAGIGLALTVPSAAREGEASFAPNAYLEITAERGVVFWTKKAEMGQHIHTALAAMAADELGADLDTLTLEQTDTHPKFGFVGTGGSYAIPGHFQLLMPMMAAAREMLMQAAANKWQVAASSLVAEAGFIHHKSSGRKALLEAFAADAANLPVPESPKTRARDTYKYIGKNRGRLDQRAVLDGTATYGIDVRVPDMRFAVIAKSPVVGASLAGFDAAAARRVAGVEAVVADGNTVFVVAKNSWAAMQGRRALDARWQRHTHDQISRESLMETLRTQAENPPHLILQEGTKSADGAEVLDLHYEMPMAQHAAIEPVNAVAHFEGGQLIIWAPCQMATIAKNEVTKELGLAEDKVVVHTTLLGGSFGRKLERGYVIEAARLATKVPYPVQLVYTREDDMMFGGVRPPTVHKIRASFGADKSLKGLEVDVSSVSVFAQQDPNELKTKGYDWTIAPGLPDTPYSFPYIRIRQAELYTDAITFNWWRGTGRNNNAYALECALDEIAAAMETDPLDLRLSMITKDRFAEGFPGEKDRIPADRTRKLLKELVRMSDYRRKRPDGRAVGIAMCSYSPVLTYVAHAVEVSLLEGKLTIHKVWVAVDCGLAISPESVRAQAEGSVIFGLTSALWGDTAVERGVVQDSNFDTCRLMRMEEAPDIEVHIMNNKENPGGMGEPPLPSVTPAFLNAIALAGGPRIRRLPIADQLDV
jgi:isoquinoline 1-oxidoreductase beta subunit